MTTEKEHWHSVQNMLWGYRTAQVLIAATELGVFRGLADGAKSAADLAASLDVEPRALARVLNAAVALDLLAKENGRYANGPLAQTCLAQEGPYFLGNLVARENAFFQRWGYLPQAARTGRRPEPNIRDEGQRNWVRDFELALYDLARVIGPAVADALALPEKRPLRILDVGGGHGGYSMALARRYLNVHPTIYELPAAAAVAREIIAAESMSDRVSVQEGDFQQQDLGQGYNVVLLFGVLVSETPAGKLALLRKAYEALVPGGTVAIRGFWLNDERTGPLRETLFSLHMLLSTGAGDISTLREMDGWVAEAGFVRSHLLPLPDWIESSLYLATKPE